MGDGGGDDLREGFGGKIGEGGEGGEAEGFVECVLACPMGCF